MDLLGGYGSDCDSSSSSVSTPSQQQAPPQPPQPQHTTAAAAAKPQPLNTCTARSKKQRKLLSLNAVLPAEVFERLVRHQERDAGNADVSYSSSEEEDAQNVVAAAAAAAKEKNGLKGNRSVGSSGACSQLLDQLNSKKMAPKKRQDEAGQKLGAAFLSVTTTRTSKKRGDDGDNEVVDVHAVGICKPSAAASSPPQVKVIKGSKGAVVEPVDMPVSPSALQESSVPTAPSTTSRAVNIVSSINSTPGLPYPTKHQYRTEKSISKNGGEDMNNSISAAAGPASTYVHNNMHARIPDASKKMSRKEMQKALRAGNFDSVLNDDSVAKYQQTVSQYQAPDAADSSSYASADRVRHVAVGLYDPKEGKFQQLMMLECDR